ncbi:DUF6246 family protein [Cronobacter dublinensis]
MNTPLKDIGECLISVDCEDYFFRPSFVNMSRIGEPEEIVQVFYDLHNDEVTSLVNRAVEAYGYVPQWLFSHIKTTNYGRKAFLASVVVLNACCDKDAAPLTGVFHPSKSNGRTFKIRKGALPESDMLLIAQSLITHGVIGKAKVRKLQRHESGETSTEFRAVDYIVAAQAHFGMTAQEASNLTMTKFQMLLATKFPEQKGFTKEEYDTVADDYFERKARRLGKVA